MMIVNNDSRVFNKLEASLTDDARVVIYDRHMFIVQATEFSDKFGKKISIHHLSLSSLSCLTPNLFSGEILFVH
jgi:hypothetical protein